MDQLEIASSMRLLKKYFETKKNASSTEQASTCYHSKIDVESHLPNFVYNETIGKVGWLHYKILYLYGCKTRNILWRKAWAILTSNTLCLHIRRKYNILSFISREFVIPLQLRNFDVYPVWDLASASASLSSPKQCVFRLFTCNSTDTFTELYLQAANIQEMCEWIHELRRHAKGRMPKNPPSLPVHLSLGTRAIKNSAQRHNTKNIPNSNNKSQSILVDNIHFNDDRFSIRRHFSNYIFRKPTTKLAFRRDSLCSKLPSQFKAQIASSKALIVSSDRELLLTNRRRSEQHNSSTLDMRKKDTSLTASKYRCSGTSTINPSKSISQFDFTSTSRFKLTKQQTNRRHNFAIDIEQCEVVSSLKNVPAVVVILTKIIERRGLCDIGLYRQTGNSHTVSWMIDELDKGIKLVDFDNEKWCDIRATASTLKAFFVQMPECLFGEEFYHKFIDASKTSDEQKRLQKLCTIMLQLPQRRLHTILHMIMHFGRIVAMSHLNKADAHNISIIFGPTLLWHSHIPVHQNLIDNPVKMQLLQCLIFNADHLPRRFPLLLENSRNTTDLKNDCSVRTRENYQNQIIPLKTIIQSILDGTVNAVNNGDCKSNLYLASSYSNRRKIMINDIVYTKNMSVTVNNKESVTNRYWQEQQLSFFCGEVDRNSSHLSLCLKNQVEANRSFSLQNQQTNLMKNRVNLERKPNSTYFASSKEESDKSKVRYKANPRKTESLNDKHSLRYDRAPKEPIKPFTKIKRRHTFSTAVELVTSGAKLSGKWWIAKVNSFKVNAKDISR